MQSRIAHYRKMQLSVFFETYFDVKSLVDVIAMNTVVGATDDWRIRHNFFWYVKKEIHAEKGIKTKKLVMLPWDFDRINDSKAESRLSGTPWFKSVSPYSAEGQSCAAPLIDPVKKSMETVGNDMAKFEHFKKIWELLPRDMSRVIQCDKITKLMSLFLKEPVQARTLQLIKKDASLDNIKEHMAHFGEQITEAQLSSGDKPHTVNDWNAHIQALYDYITKSQKYAIDHARESGITFDNYKQYLWGKKDDPEDAYLDTEPEPEVPKMLAAGQAIFDKPKNQPRVTTVGSTAGSTFPRYGVPAPRQFGSPITTSMNGFSSNLPGSFGGFVSFRG